MEVIDRLMLAEELEAKAEVNRQKILFCERLFEQFGEDSESQCDRRKYCKIQSSS
jgi:hypothetical protein